jgi:predicted outer membrane repeat protein
MRFPKQEMSMTERRLAVVSFVLAAIACGAAREGAATVVTSVFSSGVGTLSQAILDTAPGGTITFDSAVQGRTISVTTSELVLTKNVTIDGGALGVTLDPIGALRVFRVDAAASVTLKTLTLTGGEPTGDGGAIQNSGSLNLSHCVITDNVATKGGAINNDGTMVIDACTISSNSASQGGGICNGSTGTLTINNTTFSGNSAALGGALASSSNAYLTHVTVFQNFASIGGGVYRDGGTMSLKGTILANNLASTSAPDCSGAVSSSDYNLIRVTNGCTISGTTTHNITAQDPQLGSLQHNGGYVPTHAVLPSSPTLDWIPAFACGVLFDARGVVRAQDGDANGASSCDIGAYEAVRPIVVNSLLDPTDAGKCTLRNAVSAATQNATMDGCAAGTQVALPDRITFSVAGTITLIGGPLSVTTSMSLEGPGAGALTLSGADTIGLFSIQSGGGPSAFVVSGLKLANGFASLGGAILYQNASDDILAVDRCFFSGNHASVNGGSIYVSGAFGIEISASTFYNQTPSVGSAVALKNTTAILRNTTLSSTASSVATLEGIADGVSARCRVTLLSCTVAGSDPTGLAMTSLNGSSGRYSAYGNTVFSGHSQNFLGTGSGSGETLGNNISSDTSTFLVMSFNDLEATDPKLGPLVLNGGAIPTHNLLAGSPAIDHVPSAECRLFGDARGVSRPVGSMCDAGAIEKTLSGDVNLDGSVTVLDVFALINYLFAAGATPAGVSNVNGDSLVSVLDVFYLINFLFASGPVPV